MVSKLTQGIIETYRNRPNVAILMSRGGANAEKILADEEVRDLYNITTVVADRSSSRGEEIASTNALEHLPAYAGHLRTPEQRLKYFNELAVELGSRGVEACFYAGFMKIASGAIIDQLPGINAHPADLTNADQSGIPRFRGMDAISLMRQAEGTIGASVHTVDHAVDTGDTFIRSRPLTADQELSDRECHVLIKPIEHTIYPATLKLLGKGLVDLADIPYTYDHENGQLTNVKGVKV